MSSTTPTLNEVEVEENREQGDFGEKNGGNKNEKGAGLGLDARFASIDDKELTERARKTTYQDANAHHDFPEMSVSRRIGLIAVCTTATALSTASLQGLSIALPSIGENLDIPNSRLQWLVTANSLTTGCFLLLFSRLSDLYGHRTLFLLGMGWFTLWILTSGFAPNEIGIDVMRALTGMGTAAFLPAAIGIIGNSFPPGPWKSYAYASFGAGAPTGASLGLVLGGIVTQYTAPGWKAFFYVVAALGAATTITGFFYVPHLPPMPLANRSVDWLGAFLITLSLFGITFTFASLARWSGGLIAGILVLSVAVLLIFVEWEWYLESGSVFGLTRWIKPVERKETDIEPLMKISIWKKGKFLRVQIVAFIGWASFTTYTFFMTIFLQQYEQLSLAATTARFVPMSIFGVLINVVVALSVARIGANWILAMGTLIMSIAPLLAAIQDPKVTYWAYQFPGMALVVFGADTIFPCCTMYGSKISSPSEQAMAGGIFNTVLQLGTGIGLAITTEVYDSVVSHDARTKHNIIINSQQSNIPSDSLFQGLRAAFFTDAGLGFFSALLALLLLQGMGKVGAKKTMQKPVENFDKSVEA